MSQLEICLFVFCWVNLPLFPQIKLYQFIFQLGGFHVIVASRIIIFIAFKNLRIIKSKSPFCFWFIFLFPKHYMPIFPFSWENDPWIVHFIIQKKKVSFRANHCEISKSLYWFWRTKKHYRKQNTGPFFFETKTVAYRLKFCLSASSIYTQNCFFSSKNYNSEFLNKSCHNQETV